MMKGIGIRMKLKNVLIGIIAAIVLLTIGVCFIIGTGVLNPLEHQLSLGYKYLEQGNMKKLFSRLIRR